MYYEGDHYHHESLDLFDLVYTEDGDVHPVSECYQIEGIGWFPMSDVKVCRSMSDFRRGSEQKRVTVWSPESMNDSAPVTCDLTLFDLADRTQFIAFQKECRDNTFDIMEHKLTTNQQPF